MYGQQFLNSVAHGDLIENILYSKTTFDPGIVNSRDGSM